MKTVTKLFAIVLVLGLVFGFVSTRDVNAATICVNTGGTGGCFATLQAAIAAAAAGDTVTVAAGTYTETGQIVINKNLTIIGAGKTTTILKPAQDTGTSGDPRGWFLVQSGFTFNLSNLTLDGTGHNIYQGIRYMGSGTINNVGFTNIQYNASGPDYNGVAIAAMGGTVDISNSSFNNIGRIGVIYFGAGTGTFDNNVYTGKGTGDWLDYAVEVGGGAVATISNNVITDCLGVASVDGSTSAGVLVSTYYGAGSGAVIYDNTFEENSTAIAVGYDEYDTSTVSAYDNQFINNDFGISSTAPAVDADSNYWGTAVSSGVAAQVDLTVDFDPYWVDAGMTLLSNVTPATVFVDDSFDFPVCDTHICGYDAFTTVEEGVAAVAAGGTVNVAEGMYYPLAKMTLSKAITISGPTTGDAKVIGVGGLGLTVFEITSSNVSIQNLTLTLANPPLAHIGIIHAPDGAKTNINITGNTIYVDPQAGAMSTWFGQAINLGRYTTGSNVSDNRIYNMRGGVVVAYNSALTISNNIIYNTKGGIMNYTGSVADADARMITGNTWNEIHNEWDIVWNSGGGPYVMDMDKYVLQLSKANSDAHVVSQMTTGVLAALTGNRSHVFVDDSGTTTLKADNGNVNVPYAKIQDGVNAVVPGGTVYVAAGQYDEENILISKGLFLLGAGAANTNIAPSVVTNNSTIHVLNPTGDVKIDGFTFTMQPKVSYGSAIAVTGTTIPVDSATVTISNNVVNGSDDGSKSDYGFYGQGNNAKLLITNNVINKTGDNPIVMENQAGSTTVTNNTFYITASPDYNPYFSMAYNGTSVTTPQIVESNIFHMDHAGSGYAEAITFDTAVWNAWNGVPTDTGHYSDILIKDNIIYTEGPFARGIGLFDLSSAEGLGTISGTEIIGNQIIGENLMDDQTFGITLRGDIEGTLIQNNSIGDIKLGVWYRVGANSVCPSGTDLDKNQLVDLGTAIQNDCTATADASPTWWGSAAGPDPATIIGPVNYVPWCTDVACTDVYGPVKNVNRDTYFGTIQASIDDAATVNGDVITVAAGTYPEQVIVNKSVDLRGPNYGISAGVTPGIRVDEAVVTFPATPVMEPTTETLGVINVLVPDVSINGFTLDGQGVTDGVGINAIEDNLIVKNNIVKNFQYMGVWITSYRLVGSTWINTFLFTGAQIQDNLITNDPGLTTINYGIYVQGGTGQVSGNVVNNVRSAIQIQPYKAPGPGSVTNNDFSAYRIGMYYNYTEDATANWTFTGNKVTGIPVPVGQTVDAYEGIRIQTQYTGSVTFTGNTINIGTSDAGVVYMLRKIGHTGGTIDLEATLDNNTWEKVVVVRDSLGDIRETTLVTPALNKDATFFSTIQSAIDDTYTVAGDTVDVSAGTYVENVLVNKSVTVDGAGSSTIVMPGISNPTGGSGSIYSGASNVFLVQANNVKITDLVIDGDNPDLVSGVVVGGADLDARNGIITNHLLATPYNGLEVSYVTVKNIYLRGIYPSSGGTFNIHHNTVTNVQGEGASIAIFGWGGPGTIANNVVSYANDGISANHSKGIQFLNNTVSFSGSGIHTDNSGDGGGVSDVISGNTVNCTSVPNAYGIWTFVNYLPVTISNNTATGCSVAYSVWGGKFTPPAQSVTFTGNTATAPAPNTGSVGFYLTTDTISWGYSDVAVNFVNNTLTGFDYGIQIEAGPMTWNPELYEAKTISGTIERNNITGSTSMAVYQGEQGTYTVSVEENWWGSILGPQAPISDGLDVIQWCGTANPTCLDLMPQSGSTLTLPSDLDLGDGNGIYVPGLTFVLANGTSIAPTSGACFEINADFTTIEAATNLGAVCVPAAGANGINVADGLEEVSIKGLEFDGSEGGVDGIHFNDVANLMIIDNWFHNLTGDAIEFTEQPAGVVSIQGNLFQANGGLGINASTFTVPAEYNSWGHVDGAVAGDGKSANVDADPYTHVDLYITASGVAPVGGTVAIKVYGNLENVYGTTFSFIYPATLQLDPLSLTNESAFVPASGTSVFTVDPGTRTITFDGYMGTTMTGPKPPISGEELLLFSAEFEVLPGTGGVLDLVDTNDKFIMVTDTDPAPSTNIYAFELVDGELINTAYTVIGKVTMQGRSINSGVPVALTGTGVYGPYTVNSIQANGNNYTITAVAGGEYTFSTNQPRYLNVTSGTFGISPMVNVNSNITLPSLVLKGGNANWANNRIDAGDASVIGTYYGQTINNDADVNFDGKVDITDLTLVGGNFLLTSANAYGSWLTP